MANERKVTRTITSTEVEYLAIDVAKSEVVTVKHTFAGKIVNTERALALAKKLYDTPDLVIASVSNMTTSTNLYAMSEQEFMVRAEVVPSRPQKRIAIL